MEDLYWLNNPIHQNMIKFEMTEEFKENLVLSFDGSIIAVKQNAFDLSEDEDDILYKMGYKKKDEVQKKKRGMYYNFIDTEEEFRHRIKLDSQS